MTQLTSIWENEQNIIMDRQIYKNENQDKNTRDDATTHFLVRIRMLHNVKAR